jgi:hypothetical protein
MYTEIDLSTGDYTFFFKKGNQIIEVASNGHILDKFLTLNPENQDKLFDYFYKLEDSSDFGINPGSPDYPIMDSFILWAKKGIYSYDIDMDSDDEILVAIPTSPLNLKSLPSEISKLLTEF